MLKKDYDRLKKAAKKQQALQQEMLDVAVNGYQSTAALVPPAHAYPAFGCPFIWGTAIFLVLLFVI